MNDTEFLAALKAGLSEDGYVEAAEALDDPETARNALVARQLDAAAAKAGRAPRPRPVPPGAATGPAGRHPGTKPCPGCATQVFDHLLACRRCWGRLPRTAREAIVRGYSRDVLVLSSAIVDAVTWWRTHPSR